jgi:uncharacterized protein YnzC (UPF0291/DUF896 family)
MGKEEKRLLIISIAISIGIDGIGVGLGMMGIISHFWGAVIVIVSSVILTLVLIFGVFRAKNKQPSLADINRLKSEMSERVKTRRQYLPQLKETLKEYISRVEQIAQTDSRLYDLKRYKKLYIRRGFRGLRKAAARVDQNQTIYWELFYRKVYLDNFVYRKIKLADANTRDILQRFDTYLTDVKDKRLRKYMRGTRRDKGIIEASHAAYSYIIFCTLTNKVFGEVPKPASFLLESERKMTNHLRGLHNMINQRIDELLGGGSDEG